MVILFVATTYIIKDATLDVRYVTLGWYIKDQLSVILVALALGLGLGGILRISYQLFLSR
jgi:hypothetical protein